MIKDMMHVSQPRMWLWSTTVFCKPHQKHWLKTSLLAKRLWGDDQRDPSKTRLCVVPEIKHLNNRPRLPSVCSKSCKVSFRCSPWAKPWLCFFGRSEHLPPLNESWPALYSPPHGSSVPGAGFEQKLGRSWLIRIRYTNPDMMTPTLVCH